MTPNCRVCSRGRYHWHGKLSGSAWKTIIWTNTWTSMRSKSWPSTPPENRWTASMSPVIMSITEPNTPSPPSPPLTRPCSSPPMQTPRPIPIPLGHPSARRATASITSASSGSAHRSGLWAISSWTCVNADRRHWAVIPNYSWMSVLPKLPKPANTATPFTRKASSFIAAEPTITSENSRKAILKSPNSTKKG